MNIYVIPMLALLTMVLVGLFAWREKRETEERRFNENTPKSSLAKDGDPYVKAP
jgi:hypothetical protein